MVAPYVDDVVRRLARLGPDPVDAIASDSAAELPPQFTELLAALHELRTLALHQLPKDQRTILSVGPNGRWYFDWFDGAYGPVPHHIAVEAYVPRPPDLPAGVEWIPADLAAPDGVPGIAADSVDLVFSGQNIEHLWPDQMVSFLVESSRVLRDSGWLVLDSPNRDITAAYRWSMGEHTVELTPGEAQEILALAGFDVTTTRGLWLCRDGGQLLPLGPEDEGVGATEVLRRMMLAPSRPADSFIWWIEARKARKPDVPGIRRAIGAIFSDNWCERVDRLKVIDGHETIDGDGRPAGYLARGSSGYVVAGPWMALRPGSYEIGLDVTWSECDQPDEVVARLEVLADDEIVGTVDLVAGAGRGRSAMRVVTNLSRQRFYVQARLWCTGAARIEVPLRLALSPDCSRVEWFTPPTPSMG